ncbi:MAG: hypothetical protein JO007_01515 [Alphaproteobacteria bacterium]|nr:hypothetical protein [Alphaproteobacteria bacterium]
MPNDLTAAPNGLHWLTIADAARLIERCQLSPIELIEALIARRGPRPAAQRVFTDDAQKSARAGTFRRVRIMAGNHRGPLHGIPFGLKDIYATTGIRTTSHSKICEHLVPTEDAATVATLYQAGTVCCSGSSRPTNSCMVGRHSSRSSLL